MWLSRRLFALTAIALLAASMMPLGFASAQSTDAEPTVIDAEKLKLYRARGVGVAATPDGDLYMSRLGCIAATTGTEGDLIKFDVKRGIIVIFDNRATATDVQKTASKFVFVPGTWHGVTRSNGQDLDISGEVADASGAQYKVHLSGKAARQTAKGWVLFVEGTLTGGDVSYELTYIIWVHQMPAIRPVTPIAQP